MYFLIESNAIKIKLVEEVAEFIKIFKNLYNSIPLEIKPPPVGAKVVFAGVFELDFGFTLRERWSPILDQIYTNALEIESNMSAAGKIKIKNTKRWIKRREKKKKDLPVSLKIHISKR